MSDESKQEYFARLRERFPVGSYALVRVKVLEHGECGAVGLQIAQRGVSRSGITSAMVVGAVDRLEEIPQARPAAAGEDKPWRPKVGNLVSYLGRPAEVLASDGDVVWVKVEGGVPETCNISALEPA